MLFESLDAVPSYVYHFVVFQCLLRSKSKILFLLQTPNMDRHLLVSSVQDDTR